MTEHKDTKSETGHVEGRETSDTNVRTTVWMDVGHLPPQPEGALEAAAWKPNTGNKILVYADSGEVVAPQPDYPVAEDVPADGIPLDPETGAPMGPEPKAESKKSGN